MGIRVLLLNPPGPGGRGYIREGRCEQRLCSFAYRMIPISLPSVAATLMKDGHQVQILDAGTRPKPLSDVLDKVREFRPDLVVFNVSTPTYRVDADVILAVSRVTGAHRTAIGVHVTALPGRTLAETALDSVVRGEPEASVAALAFALDTGAGLDEVAGLSFRARSGVRDNPDRPPVADLDSLPEPARDLLPESDYVLPVINRPYTLVVPSRGCPHRCIYCTAHLYYGRRLRLRDPARVVDEVEGIAARGVVRDVVMWSDTFTLEREFALEVCDELTRRRLGVRWMCNSRVDTLDVVLARRMKDAGCIGVSLGVESGDQAMLERMKKGTTVAQAFSAVRAAREADIPVLAQFVLGVPGETPESLRRTLAHAVALDPDYAQFYCATPMPGTELWDLAVREGYLVSSDFSRFEFNVANLATPWLSASELGRWRRRAYRTFYLRPRPAMRMVGRIRPRHLGTWASQVREFLRGWVLDG